MTFKSTFNLPNVANIVTSVNTNVPVKGTGGTILLKQTNGSIQGNMHSRGGGFYSTNGLYLGNNGAGFDGDVGLTTDASKSGIIGTVTKTQINCNYIIKC